MCVPGLAESMRRRTLRAVWNPGRLPGKSTYARDDVRSDPEWQTSVQSLSFPNSRGASDSANPTLHCLEPPGNPNLVNR